MESRNYSERSSISDLLRDLRNQAGTLLRQEVALAKTELSEKAVHTTRNLGWVGAGGVIMTAGFVVLLTAAVEGVHIGLAYLGQQHNAAWLAPLIVGGLVALIGLAIVQKGMRTLSRTSVVPEKTVMTLREDKQWLTNKVN